MLFLGEENLRQTCNRTGQQAWHCRTIANRQRQSALVRVGESNANHKTGRGKEPIEEDCFPCRPSPKGGGTMPPTFKAAVPDPPYTATSKDARSQKKKQTSKESGRGQWYKGPFPAGSAGAVKSGESVGRFGRQGIGWASALSCDGIGASIKGNKPELLCFR